MMERLLVYTVAILSLISGTIGRKGFGPGEQEWGYVQVRPYAHMFWWLYYTTANVNSFYDRPLIIWLQGGPGGSSTSFGNFEELGPLDTNLNPRNYTWVKDYNVLFIDNPVGTGFSYVQKTDAFTKSNDQIAIDLVECMRGFYKQLPKFEDVATYITTESYGGKMGAEFAYLWDRLQAAGKIKSNLKGIALGDSWISPIDSVLTWGPFLLFTGMVDTTGFKLIDAAAQTTKDEVNAGKWETATQYWAYTQNVVFRVTNVDFYNILTKRKNSSLRFLSLQNVTSLNGEIIYRHFVQRQEFSLDSLMNGPVKEALGLQVPHGVQSSDVFDNLMGDFMKPVISEVEKLLQNTTLKVFVYSGQLDLIVDTPGTLNWVEKMNWKGAINWKNAARYPLVAENIVEGFVKTEGNFRMYWVNRAGHMVPKDNPAAMKIILEDFVNETKH